VESAVKLLRIEAYVFPVNDSRDLQRAFVDDNVLLGQVIVAEYKFVCLEFHRLFCAALLGDMINKGRPRSHPYLKPSKGLL
jgi:hypothetical protein